MVALQVRSGAASRGKLPISSHVVPGIALILDSIAILAAALAFYLILIDHSLYPVLFEAKTEGSGLYVEATVFIWLVTVLLMNFAGLYQFEAILRPFAFADKIILSFVTTFLFLLAAAFSIKISATFSRLWVGSFAVTACIATFGIRIAVSRVVKNLADMQMFTRNVVVVGIGDQAKILLEYLERNPTRFLTVLGVFTDRASHPVGGFGRFPVLGAQQDIDTFVRSHIVDDIIVALPWSADREIATVVDKLRELPVNVYLSTDLVGFRLPFRQPPDHFGAVPLVEVMGRPLAGWEIFRKTCLDYGFGVILTLVLLPLMGLIAIAIKLDSKGPLLYRQKRYGFVNKVFEIYKFRTMRHEPDCGGKLAQATRDDPRVTRVGRFLRKMSLDELPQLFNVLNGTMSLVGPRPHAIDHNEEFSQTTRGYFARHRVKPGITGWAQVNGLRGETKTPDSIKNRTRYDIHYVENWSLLFDLQILAMTIVVCLTRRNAY
jgi:Undecaprenyl-phosphate glucose phosphotransferase